MRWLPLLLTACILDENDWFRARDEALCELQVACFDRFPDEDACEATLDPDRARPEYTCDDFAAGAAQDCVEALRTQADDCPAERVEDWQIPAVCADVCEPPGE